MLTDGQARPSARNDNQTMTPHIYTTDMNIRESSSASQQNKLFKHLMIERVTQQYGQQQERTDLQVLG